MAVARGGRATLHLPWRKHAEDYLAGLDERQRCMMDVQVLRSKKRDRDEEAFASVDQHHPAAGDLSWGARLLHARNYRILVPEEPVDFVVALPARHNGRAVGGTMQGIRVAEALSIPVVRLDRLKHWTRTEAELIRLTSAGLWGRVQI
jgi:hypothetical protein